MATRVKQKERGKVSRSPKKMILIGAEGKNETEITYFKEFNRKQNTYTIKAAKGNSTDPKGIVEDTVNSVGHEELDFSEGDMAYCVFDSDTNPAKQGQIDSAIRLAKKQGVEVLLSVPCFEIWFLQHFEKSTGQLNSSNAVERLKRYIPEYQKSASVYGKLEPLADTAVKNAKYLEKHHAELGKRPRSMDCNPSTEVYRLVELLKNEK